MELNPPVFISTKVKEDTQGFIDDIEKILPVMYVINVEGVEFVAY